MVFVGQGEDEQKLKAKTQELGIEDKVCFVGVQKDIQAWLSSFDLFLFPSLFEGLSVVALEAQANGITALAADKVIPEDIKINDNFIFFSLDNDDYTWSEKIKSLENMARADKSIMYEGFLDKGFDIRTESQKLEELLLME